MKYQFTVVIMAIIKKSTNIKCRDSVEKRESSFTAGRKITWCSHYGKQYGISSKN